MSPEANLKSWSDAQKDKYQYDYYPSFPACSPARTTFYATDAEEWDKRGKFARLWKLQHGRGHTYEDWDGQRIRPETVFTYRRARVILSQAGVRKQLRESVARRVVRENLTGFSRHYQGLDGAAIGFAALYQYATKEIAMNSYLVDKAEELLGIDGEQLIDYVWRKYGSGAE